MNFKAIFLLSLGMFALGLDAYIVAGIIPNISHTFNSTPSIVGQSVAIFTLCYALSAPFLTILLSKYRAKTSLLTALTLFFLANIISAFCLNIETFFLCRAVAGLLAPVALGTATQLCDIKMRGKALGFTLAGMSLGTVIGVPVGLWLAQQFDWRYSLIFVALIGLTALIGITVYMPKGKPVPSISISERLKSFKNKHILTIMGVTFLTGLASLGLYTYLAILVQHFKQHTDLVPYFWFWGLGGLIGSFSIGYFLDLWKSPKQTLSIILGVLIIVYAILPVTLQSPLPYVSFVPILLWGIMAWASLAPQQHKLMDIAPENINAVLGLNSSINYLGASVGAMLGGVLIAHIHNFSLWLPLSATIIAISSFYLHIFSTNNDKHKAPLR